MIANFQQDVNLALLSRHSDKPVPKGLLLSDLALLVVMILALAFMVARDLAVASSITFLLATVHGLLMAGRFVIVVDLKRHRRNIDRLIQIISTPTIVQINDNVVFTYIRPSESLVESIERVNRVLDGEKKVK